jgi:hypothetical protein
VVSRDRAERLVSYLEDAEEALQRAPRAASGFPKEERLRFSELLHQAIAALNSDGWKPIYDQYPDLAPEYESLEPPTIDSELKWDEVRLEPPLTAKDIDDILFPLLGSHWKKVLRVLFNARDSCNLVGSSISYEVLAARLRDLADRNEIEGIGDLRMWGRSEVRLKD